MTILNCQHKLLQVRTESDRCSWIQCDTCKVKGPKKHSVTLALLAWVLYLANDHPKRRTAASTVKYSVTTDFDGTQQTRLFASFRDAMTFHKAVESAHGNGVWRSSGVKRLP